MSSRHNSTVPATTPHHTVALWARVSTDRQRRKDLSIPEQFEAMERFCAERGWPVVARYQAAGVSGAKVSRDPSFKEMLDDARKGRFSLVLTRDATRFGRSDEDALNRNRLRRIGVAVDNVLSPTGNMFGKLTTGAKFAERAMGAVGIYEREKQSGDCAPWSAWRIEEGSHRWQRRPRARLSCRL